MKLAASAAKSFVRITSPAIRLNRAVRLAALFRLRKVSSTPQKQPAPNVAFSIAITNDRTSACAAQQAELKLAFGSASRNCRCYARAHYRRANARAVSGSAAQQMRHRAGKNRHRIDSSIRRRINRQGEATLWPGGFWRRRICRAPFAFVGIVSSRGEAQRDRKNGAAKRRRANLGKSPSP